MHNELAAQLRAKTTTSKKQQKKKREQKKLRGVDDMPEERIVDDGAHGERSVESDGGNPMQPNRGQKRRRHTGRPHARRKRAKRLGSDSDTDSGVDTEEAEQQNNKSDASDVEGQVTREGSTSRVPPRRQGLRQRR